MYRFAGKFGCKSQLKPYHCLAYHSLDVAAVGKLILEQEPERLNHYAELMKVCPTELKYWLILFLGLHDLGKFARSFQSLKLDIFQSLFPAEKPIHYAEHHSEMGRLFSKVSLVKQRTMDAIQGCFFSAPDGDLVDFFLGIFASHHGKPVDPNPDRERDVYRNNFSGLFGDGALQFIREWSAIVLSDMGNPLQPDFLDDIEKQNVRQISWLLAGFGTLSDWLGSDTEFFHYYTYDDGIELSDYWNKFAQPSAKKCLEKRALKSTAVSVPSFEKSFPTIITPSPLQGISGQIELTSGPHLVLLEDVMGAGKTEAALHLAHRMLDAGLGKGLFFALPTMATSNAMYKRVTDFIPKILGDKANLDPFVVLSHSRADLVLQGAEKQPYDLSGMDETASRNYQNWFYDSRKKALLAQFGVGTIDQALVGVLPMKHQCLRLYGLHQKILIVDEIHACDEYIWELLVKLLQVHWNYGGSAILLSATLPLSKRKNLFHEFHEVVSAEPPEHIKDRSYPLITVGRAGYENQEIALTANPKSVRSIKTEFFHSETDVFSFLQNTHEMGKCAVWIRNTIKDANSAYQQLKSMIGSDFVFLFHSRFVLGDRLEIEDRVNQIFGKNSDCLTRRGKILIATQVVEQSMDLDFDEMVSDLAPIDYILQRTGRLRRHSRAQDGSLLASGSDQRGMATIHIFGPQFTEEPDKDWYKNFSPSASFVYQRHGLLWATVKALTGRKEIHFPEDCRSLIEMVFRESVIPEALDSHEIKQDGEGNAKKSTAWSNVIKFDSGYLNDQAFMEDIYTPT
ncbi:MAG: CRISPR-associated helicase Cas3', partial [Candidatus Cloacimonetes bacterium]|nr:CRISPR-associated helicase Cas3' [Candidatus Cloacimonadota bacterium]